MNLSRRRFLKVSVTSSGALAIGMALPGCSSFPTGYRKHSESWVPNAWLEIDHDSHVRFVLDRVEMGQGTYTGLTTLVAEELDVDPESVEVRFAPVETVYRNPLYGIQVTGGSTSMRSSWDRIREAGAGARILLVKAAARVWQVDAADCRVREGRVIHPRGGLQLAYGELVELAAKESLPDSIPLKPRDQWRYIGKWRARLDATAKVTGRAGYGLDVTLPDLTYASLLRPPMVGGKAGRIDDGEARGMPGVIDVFPTERGVAVVARSYWQAYQARQALKVQWNTENAVLKSTADVFDEYRQAAKNDAGDAVRDDGDVEAAIQGADRVIRADYLNPFLAHATMEPMNCTVRPNPDGSGLEIWAPTQAPDMGRIAAARVTDFSPDQIRVHTTFLGGGFGRRLTQDYIGEAAEIAVKAKRPVKLVWSREDDIQHDMYRPAMLHRLRGAIKDGKFVAWDQQIVGPDIFDHYAKNAAPAQYPWAPKFMYGALARIGVMTEGFLAPKDTSAYEGAAEYPYRVPNVRVRHTKADAGLPVSYWRSVGHSHTGFAVETFMDEAAHALGKDPYEFRVELLAGDERRLHVLHTAAQKAGWGHSLPKGHAQGIAVHRSFETYVAQVIEASIELGEIQIHRVTCVVDCGQAVNPDIVRMQMEGGIIFGLTAALYGEIDFDKGVVQQSNFQNYRMLRSNQTPEIEVIVVDTEAGPTGVGEPGVPPSLPALGNALFKLTGKRQRSLPFRIEA